MQPQKKTTTASPRKPKVIQELQPGKTCKCGACEPPKSNLGENQRRLKVTSKLVVHQRAWVKENSVYDYVPRLRIEGQWLRNTGFETDQYVIITQKKGKLIIQIEKETGVD